MALSQAIILGRPYRLTLAHVRRRATTVRGKQYERLVISVPGEDLEWVLRGDREVMAELCYHGQARMRPRSRVVLIAAEEELRRLGLDPGRLVTHRDMVEAVRARG